MFPLINAAPVLGLNCKLVLLVLATVPPDAVTNTGYMVLLVLVSSAVSELHEVVPEPFVVR